MRESLAVVLIAVAMPLAGQHTATLTADQLLDAKILDLARGKATHEEVAALYLADVATDTPVSHPTVDEPHEMIAAANNTRSDHHPGGTPNSPAATSLLHRPGIADLLSTAVENGALSATQQGSALTINTTPYALAGFIGSRDHEDNWTRYRWLRQLSLSTTVTSVAITTHGDFRNVSSGELKWVLAGNRSPRNAAATTHPNCSALVTRITGADATQLTAFRSWDASAGVTATRAELARLFGTSVPAEQAPALAACAASIASKDLGHHPRVARLQSMLAAYLAQPQYNQLALSASVQRDPDLSDFVTYTAIYAFDPPSKLTFNFNGSASYNFGKPAVASPGPVDNLRSYALELGASATRLAGNRFDATLTAKHWRQNQAGTATVTLIQFQGTLHVASSYSLPISITYAPDPVENFQRGWHFHVGIGSLLDAMLTAPLPHAQN
jgi:hypothetical protein